MISGVGATRGLSAVAVGVSALVAAGTASASAQVAEAFSPEEIEGAFREQVHGASGEFSPIIEALLDEAEAEQSPEEAAEIAADGYAFLRFANEIELVAAVHIPGNVAEELPRESPDSRPAEELTQELRAEVARVRQSSEETVSAASDAGSLGDHR